MEKAKISVIQLFSMMFMFELGTALVVNYGITAKKDVWLAILIGMCGGIVLFFIYYYLFRQYPNMTLIGYMKEIFGKHLGWMISALYIFYFLYMSGRLLRDFGDLLLSSTMPETPLLALIILMVLTICYVLSLGIEILGRTAEALIVILILMGFTGNLLVYFSGNVDLTNLLPFLENGWKPVLTTAFPLTTTFPFGEMLVFIMILPYLNQPKLVKKVWLSALISGGLILCYTAALNIAVLGVQEVERATFPTLTTIGKVNLFEFIQRLDALVILTMLITAFYKISIFFYGALIGIAEMFKIKNYQEIVYPIGIIIIFLSMMMASNFSEHIEEGLNITVRYLHISFLIIFPLLMLLVSMIRNRIKKKDRSKSKAHNMIR